MTNNHQPHPSFSEQQQAILKYQYNDNLFNVSSLSEFCKPVDSRGFAIKFVTEGSEHYTINHELYKVTAGSYLLLNGEKEASVEIDSKKNVKGICINISNEVIADVVAALARPDTPYSDPMLATFFYTEHFLENQYQSANTRLGARLQLISTSVRQEQFSTDDVNIALFFDLAEKLIFDQTTTFKQLQSIPAVKAATRRDLYRRLVRGKEYIDCSFTLPISIERIARESAMSEFHFFRLFRVAFGVSPHQYILRRRLDAAAHLLRAGQSVMNVAIDCGFADIYAFSKAFKKHFGVPPSAFPKLK